MIVELGTPECSCDAETCEKRVERVQIDPWDTWSLDSTLSKIIAPALVQLRDTTHGFPTGGLSSFDEWVEILDKMIFAHEALAMEDWEEQFHSGVIDHHYEENEDGTSKIVRGPNDTWVYDREGAMAYRERIIEGLKLFGEYYMDLWD